MSKPTSNLRLFVAAYPPPEHVRMWTEHLRTLDLPAYRMTADEQVHLTMQFIGDTPTSEMDDVIESVARSASGIGRFALKPEELLALPERGPARLVALKTDAPAPMLELQRRLAHRLAKPARSKPGDRFLPHFTLCRFRSPASSGVAPQLRASLTAQRETVAQWPTFEIERVILMRSILRCEGAEHVQVHSATL